MITLYGMLQYDPTLFDGIVLPAGMDTDYMKNEIIRTSGELFPYYQVPPKVKEAITEWFGRRKDNFAVLYTALTSEYNPLENYDRHDESSDNYKNDSTDDRVQSIIGTNGSKTTTSGITTSSNLHEVSAFNSDDFANDNKDTGNSVESGNVNTDGNTKQDITDNNTRGETSTNTHTSRIHGNIGVTTSAQMIQGEINLRMYDLYHAIALEFEHDNIIQVY